MTDAVRRGKPSGAAAGSEKCASGWLAGDDALRHGRLPRADGRDPACLGAARMAACRSDIDFRLVTGRMSHPDVLAFWASLSNLPRRELPLRTRDFLRWWRITSWPPLERFAGAADWVYCPAEYGCGHPACPPGGDKPRRSSNFALPALCASERFARVFAQDGLILSVSHFNTRQLVTAFPECADRVAYVPNAADDLFFEPPTPRERQQVRDLLGLPAGIPDLLSVANFQPRKKLPRLIEAAADLREVAGGELALVLLGTGDEVEAGRSASRSRRPVAERSCGCPAIVRASALRHLCRGGCARLSFALRKLWHPGRRGHGPGNAGGPG